MSLSNGLSTGNSPLSCGAFSRTSPVLGHGRACAPVHAQGTCAWVCWGGWGCPAHAWTGLEVAVRACSRSDRMLLLFSSF